MDKFTLEEHLSQPLQTNNEQFEIGVTFLTAHNGLFNVTSKNNKFYFMKSITDEDGYIQITIPPGAHEIESLNIEIEMFFIDKEHYRIKLSLYNQTKYFNTSIYIRNIHTRTNIYIRTRW